MRISIFRYHQTRNHMKVFISLFLLICLSQLSTAQNLFDGNEVKKFEYSQGAGVLNYFSPLDDAYWAVSFELRRDLLKGTSLGFEYRYGESMDFTQIGEYFSNANVNVYYNLTEGLRWLNVKIGAAASFLYFRERHLSFSTRVEGNTTSTQTLLGRNHNLLGGGIVMDNEIVLKEYLTLGVRANLSGFPGYSFFGGLNLTFGVLF